MQLEYIIFRNVYSWKQLQGHVTIFKNLLRNIPNPDNILNVCISTAYIMSLPQKMSLRTFIINQWHIIKIWVKSWPSIQNIAGICFFGTWKHPKTLSIRSERQLSTIKPRASSGKLRQNDTSRIFKFLEHLASDNAVVFPT